MEQVLEPFGRPGPTPAAGRRCPDLGGGDVLVAGELIGDPVGVDLGEERRAGVSSPRATPAMVAWMPDSKVASQTPAPRTT